MYADVGRNDQIQDEEIKTETILETLVDPIVNEPLYILRGIPMYLQILQITDFHASFAQLTDSMCDEEH